MKVFSSLALLGALALSANAISAGETLYATGVKQVSVSSDLSDHAGRLMPTNAIEILEASESKVKFALVGYQSEKAANVIYFTDKARIISIAFSKQAEFQTEILEKGAEYNKVKVTAYTTPDMLEGDIKQIFAEAKKNHEESCGTCHPLHNGETQVANRWPALIKSMQSRTALTQDQIWTVIQYLQKHSKDVNVD